MGSRLTWRLRTRVRSFPLPALGRPGIRWLNLPLQPMMMAANPRLTDDFGRVAVQRGPLVYALEQIDQNGMAISDVFLKANSTFTVEYRKDYWVGWQTLKVAGLVAERSVGEEPLYQPYAAGASRAKAYGELNLYTVLHHWKPGELRRWKFGFQYRDPS